MTPELARIHQNDTYVKIAYTLKRKNEAGTLTAEDLTSVVAGELKFTMLNAATGGRTIALTATGVTFTASTAGSVEYDFSAIGSLPAGYFNGFFNLTKSGKTITFPIDPGGLRIEISSDTATAEEAYDAAVAAL